jgi:hypothetical protein
MEKPQKPYKSRLQELKEHFRTLQNIPLKRRRTCPVG